MSPRAQTTTTVAGCPLLLPSGFGVSGMWYWHHSHHCMSLSSLTKHYYAGQFKGRDLSVFWHSLGVVFFRFVSVCRRLVTCRITWGKRGMSGILPCAEGVDTYWVCFLFFLLSNVAWLLVLILFFFFFFFFFMLRYLGSLCASSLGQSMNGCKVKSGMYLV